MISKRSVLAVILPSYEKEHQSANTIRTYLYVIRSYLSFRNGILNRLCDLYDGWESRVICVHQMLYGTKEIRYSKRFVRHLVNLISVWYARIKARRVLIQNDVCSESLNKKNTKKIGKKLFLKLLPKNPSTHLHYLNQL